MRKRDTTMDFKTQKEDNRTHGGLVSASVGGMSFRGCGLLWMVMIGASLFLSAGSALGQYGSFTITPIKVEAQITPGKTIQTVLNIQNLDPNSVHTIDLTLVELSQSPEGDWMIIDTNDPNSFTDPNSPAYQFDVRRLSSCRSWIRLNSNAVTLAPSQFAPVELSIKVARGQKGFHTAGILATIRPRPDVRIPVSVRFLVPVVVEVETRAIRTKIQSTDVGLEYVPASAVSADVQATTLVTMDIQNDGGTLSRLKPIARVSAFSKNRWHLVTTAEFDEKRIIPGAMLRLKADIHKTLPSGKYKIQGELYVDGRRTKRIEKILDFQSDPRITRVAADAPLDIKPLDVTIDCSPGSLRAETFTVYNASDETVHVQTAKGLQPQLQQKVLDNVKGADLDCTNWLQISPENFTLPGGGGRKKIRVVANLPANAMLPCYYSLLALWATYPDGQRAGYRTANVFVRNSNISAEPGALGLYVKLNELEESKYFVSATFRNVRTPSFKPLSFKAGVIPTTGAAAMTVPRLSTYLAGDPSPMLPFEDRTFVGDLDFSTVPAGRYYLTGRLEYAPGQIARPTRVIDVSIQGDRRIVQTVGTNLELGGAVEVKW